MEIEGSIRILKLGRPTDPEPGTYDVTFAPSRGGALLRQRKCVGLRALEAVLKDIGIPAERRAPALAAARQDGHASIPAVRLTEDQRKSLGL